jgi:hypothetical protein
VNINKQIDIFAIGNAKTLKVAQKVKLFETNFLGPLDDGNTIENISIEERVLD